jgi:hypothetical protein
VNILQTNKHSSGQVIDFKNGSCSCACLVFFIAFAALASALFFLGRPWGTDNFPEVLNPDVLHFALIGWQCPAKP